MLRTLQHSITRPGATASALAAAAVALSLAACRDSGIKPGAVATTGQTPVVAPPETASTSVPAKPTAPENVSYATADSAFKAKQYSQATEMFDVYTKSHQKNPWGYYMLGLSAWKAGQLDRAQSAFEDAVELDPKNVKTLVNLGRVLLDEEHPADARKRAMMAIAIDSGSADAYRVLGRAESRLGDADSALDAFRTALAIDPNDVWSMNDMGLLLIQRGQYDEALGPLARAVQLADGNATFANNLGIALEHTGHYAAAAESYKAALATDSTYDKARVSLARVTGRPDEAEAEPVTVASLGDAFAKEVTTWREQRLASVPPAIESATASKDTNQEKTASKADSIKPPKR